MQRKHFWMTLSKMFSIWLAASTQVEDKPFIDYSSSRDLLSTAHLKTMFRSARLGGDAEIWQLNKAGYRPEGKTQNKIFNCIRVRERKDMRLDNFIHIINPLKITDKWAAPWGWAVALSLQFHSLMEYLKYEQN